MRQHLILVMMQSGDCNGLRVNDIAAKTRLSRPAVSHHLQILKDAGIVKMRTTIPGWTSAPISSALMMAQGWN